MTRLPKAPLIRTALVAFAFAFVLMVSAFVRAVRIPPVEAAPMVASGSLVRAAMPPSTPIIDIDAVGANDIFQPDRTALPSRYRMPGESGPEQPGTKVEPDKPIVLGTVIATDGQHFATCQLPGGKPMIVRVGDGVGLYTVVAIERTKVVFRTPKGALIEIPPL